MLSLRESVSRKNQIRLLRVKALERHFIFLNSLAFSQHAIIDYLLFALIAVIHLLSANTMSQFRSSPVRHSSLFIKLYMAGQIIFPICIAGLAVSLYLRDMKYLRDSYYTRIIKNDPDYLYRIYIIIYRYCAILVEPLCTGIWLRMVIIQNQDDFGMEMLSSVAKYLLVFFVIIFQVQSLLYILYAENILPRRNSIMANTSKLNVAMINLSIKIGLASDTVINHLLKSKANFGWLILATFVRCLPYLIIIYYNLKSIHFFHRFGANSMFTMQLAYILACFLYMISQIASPDHVLDFMLMAGMIFAPMIVRMVMNIYETQHNFMNPNNCSLSSILKIAHSMLNTSSFLSNRFETVAIERQVYVAFYLDNPKFKEFLEMYEKDDSSEEIRINQFILYLFDSYAKRNPQDSSKALIYKTFFLTKLNMNFYQLSIIMSKIESLSMSKSNLILVGVLRLIVSTQLEGIYKGRLSFLRTERHFYNHDITRGLESNEIKFTKFSNNLDLQKCFDQLEVFSKLYALMTCSISEVYYFYDKVHKTILQKNNVHAIFKKVFKLEKRAKVKFDKLEQFSCDLNLKPAYYLLPYALYMEAMSVDKRGLGKIIRLYNERKKLIARCMNHNRHHTSINFINLDNSICIKVASAKNKIGNIDYVSRNCSQVIGLEHDKLRDSNISGFFTEEFRPLHLAMMNTLLKHHNTDYLGQQRTRYAKIGPNELFMNVRTLIKLSPVLHSDIKFLCLIQKAEHDSCFAVVNRMGKIAGYNKKLLEVLPIIERFKGESLSLISHELSFKYQALLARSMKNIEMHDEHLPKLENSSSPRKYITKIKGSPSNTPDNLKELTIKVSNRHDEDTFSSRIKTQSFATMYVSINPVIVEAQTFTFMEAKLNINIEKGNIQSKGPYNLNHNFNSNLSSGKEVHEPSSNNNLIDIFKELERVKNDLPVKVEECMMVYQKSLSENPGSLEYSSLQKRSRIRQVANRMKRFDEFMTQPEEVRRDIMRDLQELSNVNVEEDRRVSPIEYLNLKNRLYSTITNRNKTYIIKELVFIMLIQLTVWIMCRVISNILSFGYDIELVTKINLRQGIPKLGIGNAYLFTAIISTFDLMLVRDGLIPAQKFNQILPNYNYQPAVTSYEDYWAAKKTYHRLWAIVYGIDYKVSNTYFVKQKPYNFTFTDIHEKTDRPDTYTEMINTRRLFSEGTYAWLRWRNKVQEATFEDNALRIVMDGYGPKLFDTVVFPTVLLLLVNDAQKYEALVKSTQSIVLVMIAVILVTANAVLLIVMLIRNKITFIYSGFERLYSFEIDYKKDLLKRLQTAVDIAMISEKRFEKEFFYVLHHNRQGYGFKNTRKGTPYMRDKEKNVSPAGCFGLLYFTLILFGLIIAYGLTCFGVLSHLVKETGYKINLLNLQRGFLSGLAMVNIIVMRDYAAILNKKGCMSYPTYNDIAKSNSQWRLNLTELFGDISNFVSTKSVLDPETAMGFDTFLKTPACNMVNITKYKITMEKCMTLAENNMGKSAIEVMRWIVFALKRLEENINSITPDTAVEMFTNKMYLELQFVRHAFMIPLAEEFTRQFQDKIFKYHNRVTFILDTVLDTYFWASFACAVIINILAWIHLRQQVTISLNSLLLFPTQSFIWNPAIASLLWKLK